MVLAGGKSSRFGKNKALEPFEGVPLIQRVVGTLQLVFNRVMVSANDPKAYGFLGLSVVEDRYPDMGPLGGVHAVLSEMPDEAGFFSACDMPFLNPDLIRHMALLAGEADAVVPKIGQYVEPFHAVYQKTCLGPVVRAIELGHRRIVSIYPDIHIRYLEEEEIRAFEPRFDAFINVNRPEELRKSLQRLHGRED